MTNSRLTFARRLAPSTASRFPASAPPGRNDKCAGKAFSDHAMRRGSAIPGLLREGGEQAARDRMAIIRSDARRASP